MDRNGPVCHDIRPAHPRAIARLSRQVRCRPNARALRSRYPSVSESRSEFVTPPTRSRAGTHTVPHQVNRLVIDADASFEDLRARYESFVPDIDLAALQASIDKGDLDQVRRYTAEHTPH